MNRFSKGLLKLCLSTLLLLPCIGLAGETEKDEAVFPLSAEEQKWIKKVLPAHGEKSTLNQSSKDCFGNRFLPKHVRGETWQVTEVMVETVPDGESHLVVIWLYPNSLTEGPRHYPRSQEVVLGVLALAKNGKILAVGKNIITRESDQTMTFLPRISLPKLTLWGLEEITRGKGVLTRNQVYYKKRKKHLTHAGTIPTLSSNLGLCGSFKRARAKRRGLSGSKKCSSIWHFETKIIHTKKGLRVAETLTQANKKRYKAKIRERTVKYNWNRGRLKGNRTSLRQSVPRTKDR